MRALVLFLLPFFKKYIRTIFLGIICVLIHNYLKVYSTQVVGGTFNAVNTYLNAQNDPSLIFNQAVKQAIYYTILAIIAGIFLFFTRQTIIVLSRNIEYELKKQIYQHYQTLDTLFLRSHRTGDLLNRISEDVSKVRMFLGPSILYGLNLLMTAVIVIYFMLKKNVELTLYVLLPLPIMSLLIYYISSQMNRLNHKVQEKQAALSTAAQEFFSGIRMIKSYGKSTFVQGIFDQKVIDYKHQSMRLIKKEAFFMPIISFLVGLSTILSIYFGGKKVIVGELLIGDIAEFIIYINLLTWPFASLGWITSLTQAAIAAQQRISFFLKTQTHIKNGHYLKNDTNSFDLTIKNISFTYPDTGILALDRFSAHFTTRQKIGILGLAGSGKTTLMQILLRLFDVDQGEIFLQGIPLKDWDIENLRNQIAYVPQDTFLFSDTIFNNIAFGIENPDPAEIEKAAKMAHVHENIIQFPQGYQTILGERGINLSGGQKQRIAIARALLLNRPILILDDALSALDSQTEQIILQNLNQLKEEGKLIFIVTQRMNAILDADEILVFVHGKCIQQGKHEILIQEKENFYFQQYQNTISQLTN